LSVCCQLLFVNAWFMWAANPQDCFRLSVIIQVISLILYAVYMFVLVLKISLVL